MSYLFRGAFLLALLFIVSQIMPAFGERNKELSKAEFTRAALAKESAKADVILKTQRTPVLAAPLVCNLDGVLGTAPVGGSTGTLTTRLFRGGVATTCASAPFPGNTGAGPFIYNEHQITNSSAAPLCTNVTLHYVGGGTATVNIEVAAFMAPFAAADITNAARYLGDPGVSSGNPPVDTTFAVNIPAGATVSLVVFSTNASPAGPGTMYQLLLDQDTFCGPPAPSIAANGSALVTEGCSPANSAIDPSETVTVSLTLKNNGGAATTNLVATLLSSGGVTNPSAPQNYGVIAPAGMAAKNFTFTADASLQCGGSNYCHAPAER